MDMYTGPRGMKNRSFFGYFSTFDGRAVSGVDWRNRRSKFHSEWCKFAA